MYLIVYIIYMYIYKISIGTSKTDLLQNPGRHDQRSPGQLRIPNTQDEFGLDKVRFAQAIQNFCCCGWSSGKKWFDWRSNCCLGSAIENKDRHRNTNKRQILLFAVLNSGSSVAGGRIHGILKDSALNRFHYSDGHGQEKEELPVVVVVVVVVV